MDQTSGRDGCKQAITKLNWCSHLHANGVVWGTNGRVFCDLGRMDLHGQSRASFRTYASSKASKARVRAKQFEVPSFPRTNSCHRQSCQPGRTSLQQFPKAQDLSGQLVPRVPKNKASPSISNTKFPKTSGSSECAEAEFQEDRIPKNKP